MEFIGKPLSKIGTTTPFSRTADRDPNPRIPFSNGIAGSPDTEPAMTFGQRVAYSVVFGFAIGVLVLVS